MRVIIRKQAALSGSTHQAPSAEHTQPYEPPCTGELRLWIGKRRGRAVHEAVKTIEEALILGQPIVIILATGDQMSTSPLIKAEKDGVRWRVQTLYSQYLITPLDSHGK